LLLLLESETGTVGVVVGGSLTSFAAFGKSFDSVSGGARC